MKPCPHCKIELKEINYDGIKYDECSQCSGIYFDEDELRQIKDMAEPDANWLDFDISKAVGKNAGTSPSVLKCPGCGATLLTVQYQETGVSIEACPNCAGTWLERGELHKIVQSLNDQVNSITFPEYIPKTLKQGAEILLGSEGLASEWADFKMVLYLMSLRLYVQRNS